MWDLGPCICERPSNRWCQPCEPYFLSMVRAFLVAQVVKNLPEVQETWVWSLYWDDPLEKGMATHSSILAWRIPWTEEPGRVHSMGSQRVGHSWGTNTQTHTHRHTHSMQGLSGTPICQPYTPRALPRLLTSPAGYFNEASLALALYVFSLFWVIQAMTEHLD